MAYRAGYPEGYGTGFGVPPGSGVRALRWGRWYRFPSDGRVRFIQTGRTREIGFSDWEPVSPFIRFRADLQDELEDALFPIISSDFSASAAADVRSAVTDLMWEYDTHP